MNETTRRMLWNLENGRRVGACDVDATRCVSGSRMLCAGVMSCIQYLHGELVDAVSCPYCVRVSVDKSYTAQQQYIATSRATVLRAVPAWFWYTAFRYHYSYSTITAPFPSPFVATILPYFTLASLHFLSPSSFFILFSSFPAPPSSPLSPLLLYMPIIYPQRLYI